MKKVQEILERIQNGAWQEFGEKGIDRICDEYIDQYLRLSPEEQVKADAMRDKALEDVNQSASANLDSLIETKEEVRGAVQKLKEEEAARKASVSLSGGVLGGR